MVLKRIALTMIVISLAVVSCDRIDTGREVMVRIGETHKVSWNLSFTIDSIRDYRCPTDIICIWPGDVDLFFDFGKTDELVRLIDTNYNPTSIEGYTIQIIDIKPYPVSDIIVEQKDYEITLRIDKE